MTTSTEVQALLLRMDATFPGPQLSELERKMRVEEWLDSAVIAFDWNEVGRVAWRRWKDARDKPPTPHQFAEQCRLVMRQQQLDRPRLPEAAPSPEERERVLKLQRDMRAAVKHVNEVI